VIIPWFPLDFSGELCLFLFFQEKAFSNSRIKNFPRASRAQQQARTGRKHAAGKPAALGVLYLEKFRPGGVGK
jgi:hypothetical protein